MKTARGIALPAGLVLTVFLAAGCALPPYSEELSLAQLTRAKLGAPVTKIGPVYANLEESAAQDLFYFLPDRDDPAGAGGYLARETGYGLWLWYLADYSSNTSLGDYRFVSVENGNPTSNNFLLEPMESAGLHQLSLVRIAQSELLLLSASSPYLVETVSGFPVDLRSLLGAGTTLLGASIYPIDDVAYDNYNFLCFNSASLSYFEASANSMYSAPPGMEPASIGPLSDLDIVPDGLASAFYFQDATRNTSYLSCRAGSSYASYAWNWDRASPATPATGFRQLTGIKGRIAAVLSNGQLLVYDGSQCAVYSSEGARLNEFPLGDLRFCFEQWDPVQGFQAYFSLAYWLWGRDEKSDQLYVEVYSIPTASLAGLK